MMSHSHYIINFLKLKKNNPDLIGKKAHQISELINLGIPIPDGFIIKTCSHISQSLLKEIHAEYKKLCAVLSEASLDIIASFLNNKVLYYSNVKGDANLIHYIKKILKSKEEKPINIIVQKNIQSKIKGKIFTKDPHGIDKERIIIIENNALAAYYVSKDLQVTYKHFPRLTKETNVLEHQDVIELVEIGKKLQEHFYFPQEIDFAIKDKKVYITQIKPITHVYTANKFIHQEKLNEPKIIAKKVKPPYLKGVSINPGITTGIVKIIHEVKDLDRIKPSEVIVISHLYPFLFKKIKNARAIVSNSALQKDKEKMFFRNFVSIPAVVDTKNATKTLQNGAIVTVNGTLGEVYIGGVN